MKRTFIVTLNRVVNTIFLRFGLTRFRGGHVLYLTTTGRSSGARRTVPLLYVPDGDDLIVAASNGGSDWEPGWWLNLQADPSGVVKVDDQERAVVGSEVEEPHRTELWARLSAQLDSYDGYQKKVRRRIAVVRLSPVPS